MMVVAALALIAAGAPRRDQAANDACSSPDRLSTSWEAVFGHFTSQADARDLQQRAVGKNFKNATIERDGCGDYEVEVPGGAGLDTTEQRRDFAIEARQTGLRVSFEAPCCYPGNDRNAQ